MMKIVSLLMIWMQLESKMLGQRDIAQLKPGSQKRTELLKSYVHKYLGIEHC